MQQIKRQIQLGHLELARLNSENKPVSMYLLKQLSQYSDLQSTQKTRNNYALLLSKLKELSNDEKIEWVNIKRLHANQLCKLKKWQQAIDIYLQSMLGIDITEKDEEKLKEINLEQKYPILLNLATCNYQIKNYKVAIELCNKVLGQKHGENNLKALYKKAHALLALGELNSASQLAHKLLKLKNLENSEYENRGGINRQDIIKLIEQINGKTKSQKEVYQKMFDPKDQEEEQLLQKREKQEIIDYSYGVKQQCIDWCKQTWEDLWSCLSRSRSTIKKE